MNNAVMRAAMVRIGFTEMAAQALVDEQGMDSLEEIKLLTDDEIESLCKVIRRPGGMIPAPPGGAAGGAANIPNPGVPVNQRAEGHLKLLAFYLRHQARISRTVTVAQVTLEAIRTVRELREFESTYKNPDDLPTINAKDWPKTMEAIDEYLRSVLGERKIPLAYVVRKNDSIPDDDDDVIYPTIQDEMIARAPHYTLAANNAKIPDAIYLVNRGKVWDIISKITREHPCWTYVKPAQKTRDGRMAYNGLYLHYLGPNNVDNMATMAEQKLKDTVYNGEQRRWDFEKYVNVHKQQHSVMEGLVEHGYTGIDLRSKDYIRQTSKKTTNATVNISELKTGKRKADAIEDRYYTREEYAKLTPEQKKELASKRTKRGHKPGAKDSKIKGGNKPKDVIKNLRAVNRQVSQLAKQMSKTTVEEESTVGSDQSYSTQPERATKKSKTGTNRTNTALTRQKKESAADTCK
ncbi:hypothetical protein MHU86_20706 [Fragilaria crotonensis]|nr:hypothetical protein MHU86_20706 [Fragilaria crotonensis]